MTRALHTRARVIRERAVVRAWEYRQRHHSKGVWFRFRRVLVDAGRAFVISPEQGDQLEAEGYTPLAVGQELQPPKRIFVLDDQQQSQLSNLRSVEVRLSAELLASQNLVLVPHPPL